MLQNVADILRRLKSDLETYVFKLPKIKLPKGEFERFKNTFTIFDFAKEICSKQISCFFRKKHKNANLRRRSDTKKYGICIFLIKTMCVSLVKRMISKMNHSFTKVNRTFGPKKSPKTTFFQKRDFFGPFWSFAKEILNLIYGKPSILSVFGLLRQFHFFTF